MKQRPRIYYTATQRELMWDRLVLRVGVNNH